MDKYDRAIKHLTENPDEIFKAWGSPEMHVAGCLFQFCGDSRHDDIGCLTMVRGGAFAATEELTKAIRADDRIPEDETLIGVEHLPVFAEWQRRLDLELERD